MKLRFLIPTLAFTALSLPLLHAQSLKVGVVDMNETFTSYYKTKEAEVKINDIRGQAKKELDVQLETLNKSIEEINKLQQDLQKPELSQSAKESKARELNDKANDARARDKEVAEFRQTRERQIQEQFMRMRKDIIDEIMVVVNEQVKLGGYDLVLDKSGVSMGQIPVVLYSKKEADFTPAVVAALNKNAPKSTPAPSSGAQKPKSKN